MIQFYGSPMSSSGRAHLMLEEVGVPYEYHRTNLRDDAVKAAYLEVNPTGRIPYIVDGDFALTESAAIVFYLAEKYKPEWIPAGIEAHAKLHQWAFWAMTNLQPESIIVMFASMGRLGDHERIGVAKSRCVALLEDLEREIGAFVYGDSFTVADIIVGSVVNLATRVGAGTAGPKTAAWLEMLRARPAWVRVAAAP